MGPPPPWRSRGGGVHIFEGPPKKLVLAIPPPPLVITGQDEVPVEVIRGSDVMPRKDLSTTYEEAGNIIVHQAIRIAANEKRN